MKSFALIGAAGYIAPRHMAAIKDTGNDLVAAVDPHDSVGIIDQFFPKSAFFTEIERFDRHLEKLRRGGERIQYMSICTPNYLHDAHIRLALRLKANAICEKPLIISPWNIEPLEEIEAESGCKVYSVLQLRHHPTILKLKESFANSAKGTRPEIELSYVTRRGSWYDYSWKGSVEKSGGIAMNIGIHFFDFLLWIFGDVQEQQIHLRGQSRMAGTLELEQARVNWFLSVDERDLPEEQKQQGNYAYRSITVDGQELVFSHGFTDLHTQLYESILAGEGYGIRDAAPAINLVHSLRTEELSPHNGEAHSFLKA